MQTDFETSEFHPDCEEGFFLSITETLFGALPDGALWKGVPRDSNLILVQTPRLSCYIDIVLDVMHDDHLVEKCLNMPHTQWLLQIKWVSVSMIKMLFTFLDWSFWKNGLGAHREL